MQKKKCFKSFISFMVVVFTLLSFMPKSVFAEDEYIKNADFAEWQGEYPDNWGYYTPDMDATDIMQTQNGLMISVFESYAYIYQKVQLDAQSSYKISFDVLTEDVEDTGIGAQACFMYQTASSEPICDTQGKKVTGTLYVTTNVDAEQEYIFRLGLGVEDYICTGTAYFSNLKIEKLDEIPNDFVLYTLIGSIGIEDFGNIEQADIDDYEEQEEQEVTAEDSEPVNINYNNHGFALFFFVFSLVIYFLYFGDNAKKLSAVLMKKPVTIAVFAIAFLLRIYIAINSMAHEYDINCFKAWSYYAYQDGISNFYTSGMFADYPPVYMYFCWFYGFLQSLFGLAYDSVAFKLIVQIPAMLADIALAYIVLKSAEQKLNRATAVMLSLFMLFMPVMILDSAVWGQVDSILILGMFLTLYYLNQDKKTVCAALYTLTVLTKPQAGLIAPIIIAVYVRDFLNKDKRIKTIKEIAYSALAVLVVYTAVSLPFKGSQGFFYVVELIANTIGEYGYATINAFNLFALCGGNWKDDTEKYLFLDFKTWGTVFIVLSFCFAIYLLLREKNTNRGLWLSSSAVFIMIFFLGNGMHERYIMPAIFFLLITAIYYDSKRMVLLSSLLSGLTFLNVYYALIYSSEWIPNGVVYPVAIGFMLFFSYSLYCFIEAGDSEKSILILPDEEVSGNFIVNAEYNAKHRFEGFALDNERKMTKRDGIIALAIAVVYAVVAFTHLGNIDIPGESEKLTEGQAYLIELEDSGYVSEIEHYSGYCDGDMLIYVGETADKLEGCFENIMIDQPYSEMFTWRFTQIYSNAKFIKLHVSEGDVEIREIAFYGENNDMLKIKNAYVIEENGDMREASYLFDEQNEVSYSTDVMQEMYFDEIYHARTALEYINGDYPYEITHPPLGKSFITIGIRLFGMNPFGWRFMGTLFGVMLLPLMYVFAKRIFKKTKWAAISTIIFAADFMHFTLTRISTIDSYSIFFIMLMSLFMYEYMQHNFLKEPLKDTLIPLGLCGFAWSLGCATKWLCIYAGLGLAIAFFYTVYQRCMEMKYLYDSGDETLLPVFKKNLTTTIVFCVIFFIIIPIIVYCISYIPYFNADRNFGISGILKNQDYMFNYHAHSVEADGHPFNSKVWTWIFDIRPVFFFMAKNIDTLHTATISCFGNPIIWWGGLIAIIFLIGLRKNGKSIDLKGLPYIAIMALAQFLPWTIIEREVFIYHFFATLPFLIITIVYALRYVEDSFIFGKAFVYGVVGFAVLMFICFLPMLNGSVVPSWYSDLFRWLDTWPFYCV